VTLALRSAYFASPTYTVGPTSLNRETRHALTPSAVFPDRNSSIRPVGAVPAEQPDEWIKGRRYLGRDVRARSLTLIPSPNTEMSTSR